MIENFSKNVARLRKERGYSQEDLANKLGVKKQTISNIERGTRYPTFDTLEKIVQVFNVSSVQLFGTEKEIEVADTSYVMDRMDDYEDKMQSMMRFAKIFDDYYLKEIDAAHEKLNFIYSQFHETPIYDDEGEPVIDENGELRYAPAFFKSIPFDEIDSLIKKIDYLKANQDLF
ncbi:helix-turn-helix domain-containing protein [Enterococcus faecalis]